MSDSSPLLLLLTLLLLFVGLGIGGKALLDQLTNSNAAAIAAAASARPAGSDSGPGGEIWALEPPTKPSEVSMWLRVFLGTFDSILDGISSRLDADLDRRQKAFDEDQNRRRLAEEPERSSRRAASDADNKRKPSTEDNPRARTDVDGKAESRLNAASADEDAKRMAATEDNSRARADVDGDAETRARNVANAEDAKRLSVDNPESRVPVDANPEARIRNAAAAQDTGRMTVADDNLRAAQGDPESRIRNAAASEDVKRFSVDNPESRVPVDANPESRIRNAAAAQDTGRLTTADDNFRAAQGDPDARMRNVANAEDVKRFSVDNPESRTPVDANPEARIRNAAAAEDMSRLTTADDNFRAAQGDPDARMRNAAATEDTSRFATRPEAVVETENPESRIRNAAAEQDTGRLTTADDNFRAAQGGPDAQIRNVAAAQDTSRLSVDNPESRVPVEGDPESRINNAASEQDKKSRLTAADDNFRAAQGDHDSRMRGAASVQDERIRLETPSATDNFKAVNDTPDPSIKRVSGTIDDGVRISAPKDTFKFDTTIDSKLRAMVNKFDTISQGKANRTKNIFKRPITASLVSAEIVEGRVLDETGKVKRLSDNPSAIKYDAKAAGAFGTSLSKACRETPQGRAALAYELSQAESSSRGTPRATVIKSAALRAARIAVDLLGGVGDALDVLQIVQVFGNAAYYDPGCLANPDNPALCKFPTEFLTANQAKDVSGLAIKKQIEKLTNYTPRDVNFKPRFPLIRGPLDVLEPNDPYMNQTRIQLEVDAVQDRILNGDPWRAKYVTYFGSTIVNEIINDPSDALSYYTARVGMTNPEIDSVYRQAFTTVCLYNGGKVWEDVYAVSLRPRLQCGFTKAACAVAQAKYFTPDSVGNYVEWYTYTDLETLLAAPTTRTPAEARLAPPIAFTSTPSDEDGICMVASPGTAALCNYYKGTYDVASHSCIFSPAYCQSIGTCHNSVDNTCYLPNNEMEALSFFFPGGGVREWIKVNGCTFRGTNADRASYATQSIVYTFMPMTMLFTANGRKMLQDAIANSRNWSPGLRAQLREPMVAVGFAGAVVGLSVAVGTASAVAMGFAASGIGMPVAVAIIVAVGIVMIIEQDAAITESQQKAQIDKEDTALYGLQKVTATEPGATSPNTTYIPTSTGISEGWVTRKLVTTKKADNSLCTAVDYYKNPTTCVPVVWTAENPHVVEIPFVGKYIATTISGAGQMAQAGYVDANDYSHKLQCWKKEYLRIGTTTDPFGKVKNGSIPGINVGAAVNYGDGNGTPDATTGKIFDGYIRAGTDGSSGKTWCIERKPRASLFDATIGTPAAESQVLRNRSWTSKYGDVDQYYPEYPAEASYLRANAHDHFRYQLVYARGSIPMTTMWDDGLMDAVFTEATVSEIRRYYCEQELVRTSSDTSMIDKRCFGYLNLDFAGYTWFPMSVAGKIQTAFNTTTGTVTSGRLTPSNKDDTCAKNHGANFEEESAGLCYLNCNYNGGATNDSFAYVSRSWESDGTIQCLKQYPAWEDQSENLHGELTIVKHYKGSQRQGTANSCPPGKEKGGSGSIGLCYPTCASMFTLAADEEAISNGMTECYKHYLWWENEASRMGRPAGTGARGPGTMNKPLAFSAERKGMKADGPCPDNYQKIGGVCYSPCNSDQNGVGDRCYNNDCPTGTTERTASMCTNNCPDGFFWDQTACYADCRPGFMRSSVGFCIQNCTERVHASEHTPSDTRTVQYVSNGAGVCRARDDFQCPASYDRVGVATSTPTCFRPYKSETKGSDWTVTGQSCIRVCRCAQHGEGFNSTGLTCSRLATWQKTGQSCIRMCQCAQHGEGFNSTGLTCSRIATWQKTGQSCIRVCYCDQHGEGFNSTGLTCSRLATWQKTGQSCIRVCYCDQHGEGFNSTGLTCSRIATWQKTGQSCARVCRCDSANGYESDGATCRRPERWSTKCSSYICCR